jgi:hypothetical protein
MPSLSLAPPSPWALAVRGSLNGRMQHIRHTLLASGSVFEVEGTAADGASIVIGTGAEASGI